MMKIGNRITMFLSVVNKIFIRLFRINLNKFCTFAKRSEIAEAMKGDYFYW